MNQDQFKDPVHHMCLAGTVIATWSLTQEMAGSNPFTVMTNIQRIQGKTFRENSSVIVTFCLKTFAFTAVANGTT